MDAKIEEEKALRRFAAIYIAQIIIHMYNVMVYNFSPHHLINISIFIHYKIYLHFQSHCSFRPYFLVPTPQNHRNVLRWLSFADRLLVFPTVQCRPTGGRSFSSTTQGSGASFYSPSLPGNVEIRFLKRKENQRMQSRAKRRPNDFLKENLRVVDSTNHIHFLSAIIEFSFWPRGK